MEQPVAIKKQQPITIKKKEITDETSLVYYNKYSFIELKNVGKHMDDSLVPKYNYYLAPFKQQLEEF